MDLNGSYKTQQLAGEAIMEHLSYSRYLRLKVLRIRRTIIMQTLENDANFTIYTNVLKHVFTAKCFASKVWYFIGNIGEKISIKVI